MCVCYFYLNKLFTLLKKIIIIIKTTHIKLIQNMYNLLSKFYWGERERERERINLLCVRKLGIKWEREL